MIPGKGNAGDVRREIRVMVVDEQPTMRLGVRWALEAEEGMLVVGEGEDAEEVLRLVQESRPDVVVMDLVLKSAEGGIELLTAAPVSIDPCGSLQK